MTEPGAKTLPLQDLHQAAGARFGTFAGWTMPLIYPAGVMREHLHTREHVGLFDISHMKLFELSGPGAASLVSRACPVDAPALKRSQSKLTFFLAEDAGILDDLIVTRLDADRFMIVANAGNAEADQAHLNGLAAEFDCRVEPLNRVFLAVQGPDAWAALARAGIETGELTFMHAIEPRPGWFLSRSGYTGEDGFEIGLPEAAARELIGKLLQDDRVLWVGLAARDSLRLEAGLCLHGQDISLRDDPVSAALLWAIPRELRAGGSYIGAAALESAIAQGTPERRVGLKPEGRQPVRAGAPLVDYAGKSVGRVTSGGFGPTVGHPVAMGYVAPHLAKPGTRLFAEVRGARLGMSVHTLPFTPHRYRKG